MDNFKLGNIAKTKLLCKEVMQSDLLKVLTVKLLPIKKIVYFA
jgi:hypothetical protein